MAFIAMSGFLAALKGTFEFVRWISNLKAEEPNTVDLSKRVTVKATVFIFIVGLFWSGSKKFYQKILDNIKTIKVSKKSGLIAHRRNGTIHLKDVSTGTLPSEKWETRTIDLSKFHPYGGYERRIYEAIGKEAIKQKNDFITIESYSLAINESPLSYHLYDKLTRIYGRRKEYSKILKMYEQALTNLSSMEISKRNRKKAKNEFTMRLKRTILRTKN